MFPWEMKVGSSTCPSEYGFIQKVIRFHCGQSMEPWHLIRKVQSPWGDWESEIMYSVEMPEVPLWTLPFFSWFLFGLGKEIHSNA